MAAVRAEADVTLPAGRRLRAGVQRLDGHRGVEQEVGRRVHRAHAAAPELPVEPVAPADHGPRATMDSGSSMASDTVGAEGTGGDGGGARVWRKFWGEPET